jgi:hypothetical protein
MNSAVLGGLLLSIDNPIVVVKMNESAAVLSFGSLEQE